jgi:hypothetical protein
MCLSQLSCLAYSLAFDMKVRCSSETSVAFCWTIWLYIPKNRTLYVCTYLRSACKLRFTCLSAKLKLKLKLKLIYDRQSVGQSALVSGTHLGPVTNFSFSLKFSLDSCGFVIL